jgi:Fe2+ transport system protein FeoA
MRSWRWGTTVPSDAEPGVIRLSALETGEAATVYGFVAGHGLVSRLSALGFTPDAKVTMVQNFGHGPVIVSIRGTRIALGRGEAAKVRVRRSGED